MAVRYLTRPSQAAAEGSAADGDLIVEGKGTFSEPWLITDAGTAEDLLADDIGRDAARQLIRRQWVIRMADYRGRD